MEKYIRRIAVILSITLMICIYQVRDFKVYAIELENKVDILIENKEKQRSLILEINGLEDEISSIHKEDTDNNIEIVTVSFIQDNNISKEELEKVKKDNLIKQKSELESELQKYIIEGVKIEKQIEEEKQEELILNNVEYLSGIWPVPSYNDISSPFGQRIHPITGKESFHKGIDIPAPQDTNILASDDGIISYSGVMNGYGNVIKIKHFDGKETVYAHNNSNIVKEGDIVKSGQVIAKIGTTGNSTGNHLHFETIVNGENINPINVVKE